jgi:hypothetical protein
MMEANKPSVAASDNALRQAQRARRGLGDLKSAPGRDSDDVAAPLAAIARLLEAVNQRLMLLHDSNCKVREEQTHD